MNPPQVYMCSPSWTLLPPPSPYHSSGSSQCTSPKHPVSCVEPGLATCFIHDILHVSMPFAQIFPPSPSPTESIRLFYTSVSLLLSRFFFFYQEKTHMTSPSLQYFKASAKIFFNSWQVKTIKQCFYQLNKCTKAFKCKIYLWVIFSNQGCKYSFLERQNKEDWRCILFLIYIFN